MNHKIIIIGAGASGLMLASLLPKNSAILIESYSKIAAKIRISGGGKCNITNSDMHEKHFLGAQDFIRTVLESYDEKSLLQWLKKHHLNPILRKERQYFCRDSSQELIDIFTKETQKQQIYVNETVLSAEKRGAYFTVKTTKRRYTSKYLVIASGGLSFPKIGASSIGYDIAKSFGHSIIPTAPALVGFTVQKEQFFFKALSGTSCSVIVKMNEIACTGELLFTHKGISGPAVLDASLFWAKGQIEIDFLPSFSWETIRGSKKYISALLPLPKRITKAFLVQLGLKDKSFLKCCSEEIMKLKQLHAYRFAPAGTFGYSKAEVTKGGISTKEVDSYTMMSEKEERLYFIGEVLDVTGKLGGYNFQWAFSTAYQCFKHVKNIGERKK